ncbi:MAG: preprotein translocase subunit SecG [Verrucomicrobiales bacterium]|nr:preprotein translocase subunit SecG [Verrucomicrobiales bacterium]
MSILLILIVLMQRPKQEGLGAAFGGGMMDSLAGAHTTDVLQKGTVWLATIFLSSAVLLAVLKTRELKASDPGELLPTPPAETAFPTEPPSISNLPMPEVEKAADPATPAPATPAPAAPAPATPAPATPAPATPAPATPAPAATPTPTPAPAASPSPAPAAPAEAPKKADAPAPAAPPSGTPPPAAPK